MPAIEYVNGYKEWWKNKELYFISKQKNGTKEYCDLKGNLHKSDGPAVIYPNGDLEYWFAGKRHRLGGPAVIIGNKQYWFVDGEFIKCIV